MRPLSVAVTVAALVLAADGRAAPAPAAAPADGLAVVKAHRYRMAGRIRPLLFWMGKDDVGLARLVWRGEAGARGLDFLVGTDPDRVPRRINRWGYIAEEANGPRATVLAVMSKSDEESIAEVEASGTQGGVEYKAMRASASAGRVAWQTNRVHAASELTVHDLATLLTLVRNQPVTVAARERALAADVRPGFLLAMAELVDGLVARARGEASAPAAAVPYAFGAHTYRVRTTAQQATTVAVPGGTAPVRACAAAFEIRNDTTGERTRFDMTVGLDGALAGVPIAIAWQPKWWLKVELHLEG